MIYEKLPLSYDVEKLKKHLVEFVLPLPKIEQSSSFGGWSVTSSNSDYRDGWFKGHHVISKIKSAAVEDILQEFKNKSLPSQKEFNKPTEICHGYLADVIADIADKGFRPVRARIICLNPGMASVWHQDMPSNLYGVRLHIPIETNEDCFFECEEGRAHLPATGAAYLLRVNRQHRVVNGGQAPRYHLVMDVQDFHDFSEHHKLTSVDRELLAKYDL